MKNIFQNSLVFEKSSCDEQLVGQVLNIDTWNTMWTAPY